MLSLGCPKTLVDSEIILGKLDRKRFQMGASVNDCDVAIVNTCSFIQAAKEESIDRIMQLIELKNEGKIRTLIVAGCLVQQFPDQLAAQLKEVDVFIGSGEYDKAAQFIQRSVEGEKVFSVGKAGYLSTAADKRVALTPKHFRYLKISEGCDHLCTFCTIPLYRGKHRSRSIDDVCAEAKELVRQGAKEIILTGQDTTSFGRDTNGKYELPELLRRLDLIPGIRWIRLMYAYPTTVNRDLIAVIRDSRHICHYLDMPLQHINNRILKLMRRGITRERIVDLIAEIRQTIPDIAIRTTFIAGFPGETDDEFRELLDFIGKTRFDRLGVFAYSQEEDSASSQLPGQIPEKIKQKRLAQAMLLQQKISREENKKRLGQTVKVMIDEKSVESKLLWMGRSYRDAPEIDGNVQVRSAKEMRIGNIYPVTITGAHEYDLVAKY
jgi:ribosomal protein S12 methylthiotransferase